MRDLQDNRCFYCDRSITGLAEIDHFVPWARYADNGIYLRLPGDVGLWVRRGELTPVGPQLETLRQALGA